MLSPNKKLLAVAERAEKAVVSVYDMQTLKRRKQLVAADVGSKASCAGAFDTRRTPVIAKSSLFAAAWAASNSAGLGKIFILC